VLRPRSARSVIGATVAVALIVLCAAAVGWRAEGGRWFVVRTASMGQAAPVGTLLLTEPTTLAQVRVGEIITFRAPTDGAVYSHRVVAKTAAGLRTRGDINPSPDPWVLTGKDLVGRVAHRWWGVGWVLRGAPLLLLCLAVVWLVTALVGRAWRSPLRLAGIAVSFAFVARLLHPWVGVEKIGASAIRHGVAVRAVSTGVLPVTASGRGGGHLHLVDGQVGAVKVAHAARSGGYLVNVAPSLSLWWWVAIVAACLAPLLWALLIGLEPTGPDEIGGTVTPGEGGARPALIP
jgi:signal peptidase I